MQRYKAIVETIENGTAHLVLEDGTRLIFPLSKLPKGVSEGAFLRISISVDRLAALLYKPENHRLVPKVAKT